MLQHARQPKLINRPANDTYKGLAGTVSPGTVAGWLAVCTGVVVALSLIAVLGKSPWWRTLGIRELLNVNSEANIPTLFNAGLLVAASLLLLYLGFVAHRHSDKFARHWIGLGCVLAFLAVDEFVKIHEHFNTVGIILRRMGIGGVYEGVLRWPWVLSGMVVVSVLALTFFRFIVSLPLRSRILFVTAATVYFGGAIGLEMVGGLLAEAAIPVGSETLAMNLVAHAEETCEMIGIIILIYAILEFAGPVRVQFEQVTNRLSISIGDIFKNGVAPN